MSANDGGPAFPVSEVDGDGNHYHTSMGMSLRDYFAAIALPAACEEYCRFARASGFDERWRDGVAQDAYAMADAMLAAREAK